MPEERCERCGETKELKKYKPNLGKVPGKELNCCDDCAGKDGKLIALDVPKIDPAVPDACAVTAVDPNDPLKGNRPVIKKFEGVQNEPIVTPKSEPKPEPQPAKPVSTEPISREDIRAKLKLHEGDLNKLMESEQRLLAQLQTCRTAINVKKGAVAVTRDILGKKG